MSDELQQYEPSAFVNQLKARRDVFQSRAKSFDTLIAKLENNPELAETLSLMKEVQGQLSDY